MFFQQKQLSILATVCELLTCSVAVDGIFLLDVLSTCVCCCGTCYRHLENVACL